MFRLLLRSNGRERALAALAAFFILVQVWMELSIPEYMTAITNLVQTPGGTVRDVLAVGARMLAYAFGSLGASLTAAYLLARLGADFTARMRRELFIKIQTLSQRQVGEFSLAGLITRTTNDGNHVQSLLVLGLQAFIKAPITAVWAIYRMTAHSTAWTPVAVAAVVLLIVLFLVCLRFAMPHLSRLQPLTDDINRLTRENILGLYIIRERNAEPFQSARFAPVNDALTHHQIVAGRILAWLTPGNLWIGNLLALGIYWIGVCLLAGDAPDKMLLFSDTIVFAAYAAQVISSFALWIPLCIAFPRGHSAAVRMEEVLRAEEYLQDMISAKEAAEPVGKIVFSHVTHRFSPDVSPVLDDITFSVDPGEILGVVGATGCGKSAVAALMARRFYPTSGEVSVDGVSTAEYSDTAFFQRVVYVSQQPVLFAGTVLSNLTMGDASVQSRASFAAIRSFVEETVGPIDSDVSPGGVNLSVTQRQCLSVARALCRTGEILILDDPFSLEANTRRRMLQTVYDIWQGRTLVIVSAHAEAVRHADRILVLDAGRIAAAGTHETLVASCPLYRQAADNVRRTGREGL